MDLPLGNIPEILKDKQINLTDNARVVMTDRYVRKGTGGLPSETIPETFWRVASNVAVPEEQDAVEWAEIFYHLMTDLRFLPNSPTFTGAGTPLGNLSACFVLPIDDDMGKTESGIFRTLLHAALIQQVGGGNGFSFSKLRSKGTLVASSNGAASGPVGFIKVYDRAFGEISQGGVRRGANMAILRVDHPDIREFITCKYDETSITNFNISVAITDKFMWAVAENAGFDLIDPHTNQVVETVKATELFHLIAEQACYNGEPGVLFIDTANESNPVPNLGDYEATNPCSEQWLLEYESCNLGSINLAVHVEEGKVQWEKLQETVEIATRFLDDVVSINGFVEAIPQLREAALKTRRIGLGFMGLADMLIRLNIRYDSYQGIEFAGQLTEFIRYHAMLTSIELAKERGRFSAFEGSIYDMGWSPPPSFVVYDARRPALDWKNVQDGLKAHGIRNATQLTIAPTGTLATIVECEGYGCEPIFARSHLRHIKDVEATDTLSYLSPLIHETCMVTSGEVSPEDHVRMLVSIQRYVDSSISKTINMPATCTVEDVLEVYKLAWELGCKGLTVYVQGSRKKVVLEELCPTCQIVLEKIEGCMICPQCGYGLCVV